MIIKCGFQNKEVIDIMNLKRFSNICRSSDDINRSLLPFVMLLQAIDIPLSTLLRKVIRA